MSSTPVKSSKKSKTLSSGTSTPTRKCSVDQRQLDLSGLNIESKDIELAPVIEDPLPVVNYAKEKLIEEVKRSMEVEHEGRKKGVSLVVIGRSCVYFHTASQITIMQDMLTLVNPR